MPLNILYLFSVQTKSIVFSGLLDHVTCLIGISARGHSVAGIINQPFYNYKAGPDAELGRCIWGIIGLGKICKLLPLYGTSLIAI